MVFFGAPIAQSDHAARAVRVALKMQQALAQLRQKWHAEGDKWPALVRQMRMRIGVSSGEIVTGNMGSTMRMNYTMMGDVVNTATRLEAAAKRRPTTPSRVYIERCEFFKAHPPGLHWDGSWALTSK